MKKYLFVFCLFIVANEVKAQFSFERNRYLEVRMGGQPMRMPWAGGINYGQFSEIDMDFDGRTDLFVFDRSDNQIRIFLSKSDGTGEYYVEAPEYRFSFPEDVRYRAALVDYNQDGLPDIFTYGIGGIKVYKNTGDAMGGHQWELFKSLLYSEYPGANGGTGNLYVSSSDIPAIVDVDGDGDTDILTFHIGGERMEYHKNMSMENYGIPDSLEFVVMNECWGNFREDENTNSIILNSNLFPCGSGGSNVDNPELSEGGSTTLLIEEKNSRHAGSTILALDMNNSGVMDLIIGDISFPNLVMLANGGTSVNTNSPIVSVDYNFPSNSTPSSLSLFPAGFFVDGDHDGVKDLIVAPNAKIVSENQKSVWRYRNIGTNNNPTFVFQERDFLQKEMIEAGSGSIPVVLDVNGDGLKDLIVANFFNYKPTIDKESGFMYFQNTGSMAAPVLTYVDSDKFGIKSLGIGLRAIPTFGDLDGDGDLDMLVGEESGKVHLFINEAGAGNPISFSTPVYNIQDNTGTVISAGSYSAPTLVDLDRDGLLDLVIGTKNGTLLYYKNTGSSAAFQFTLKNDMLGNIDVAPSSPDGYAVPHFLDHEGEWHLFLGGRSGRLDYYTGIEGNLTPGFDFGFSSIGYASIDMEGYSAFAISDMDNDGNYDLFAGGDLGGVDLFESDPNSSVGFEPVEIPQDKIAVYPNPFTEEFIVEGASKGSLLRIYNTQGVIVYEQKITTEKEVVGLQLVSKGMYFIEVEEGGQTYHTRVLKR